ncbi:polyprenyl synthetase family protein [Butyrivibrio proteoclasticus]|uniref:polyprenyl synthetase family protein n=1 Tax=Butyrivibrio proteoclasticus TaxID=43305 RepID=UPI00047EE997|nr:farnesyl diphosphate synthase [Butyrivibrio proteoclasticus]
MGSDFEARLSDKAGYVEDILQKFLPREEGYAKTVIEAMNYSLLAGGKRLRPVMMMESYKLFAGSVDNISELWPFMAAMEMIHTYSLVHDDLPAMDNDEYRRGRKTTHAMYGAGMATLAGDGLLNYAFETAIMGSANGDPKFVNALKVLSQKAGIYGMVGGQCADIVSENRTDIPADEMKDILHYIDENKTGALIESSLMIGAIIAGADEDEVRMIEKAGSNVGIAFQIQDDILDIEGDEALLGKPVGSDIKNAKTTYVSLYGMEQAKNKVKELSDEALGILDELGFKDSFLGELFSFLIYRKK